MDIWNTLGKLDILIGLTGTIFAILSNRKAKRIQEILSHAEDAILLNQERSDVIGTLSTIHSTLNAVDSKFTEREHKNLQNMIIDLSTRYPTIFDDDEDCKSLKKELKRPTVDQVKTRELLSKIITRLKKGRSINGYQ